MGRGGTIQEYTYHTFNTNRAYVQLSIYIHVGVHGKGRDDSGIYLSYI